MRPKIRGIGTVALGVISGANAIYQLVFRQDIVLLIVSAMVSVLAFYIFVNRDNPDKKDQLQKIQSRRSCLLYWYGSHYCFYPLHE